MKENKEAPITMTADEYCNTAGVAFDRWTTKAAFEAGRLDHAKRHDQDLAAAYIDGHARGRESLRIELERQKPVARVGVDVLYNDTEVLGLIVKQDGRVFAGMNLFARPLPPPDVRELVHVVEYFLSEHDAPNDTAEALDMLRAAFSKHRSQP